jgi:hypothetical protein
MRQCLETGVYHLKTAVGDKIDRNCNQSASANAKVYVAAS